MATTTDATQFAIRDLGRMSYPRAVDVQRRVHRGVVAGTADPTLLLVEHDPVVTISRRPSAREHLMADEQTLAGLGIDVQQTDRGGDITYHGPGQLVAYPIIHLVPLGLNVGRYIRLLERFLIEVVDRFGVRAHTQAGFTGVWVGAEHCGVGPEPQASRKIGAIGVRVERNVTLHGMALNVSPNLDHYRTIIPCGLSGRGVTSLREQLGDRTPTLGRVKSAMADAFGACLTSRVNAHAHPAGVA